jgi:hypothetical protein
MQRPPVHSQQEWENAPHSSRGSAGARFENGKLVERLGESGGEAQVALDAEPTISRLSHE